MPLSPAGLLELPPQVGDRALELARVSRRGERLLPIPPRQELEPSDHRRVRRIGRHQGSRARHVSEIAAGAIDVDLGAGVVLDPTDELTRLPQEAGHLRGGDIAIDTVRQVRGAGGEGEDVSLQLVESLAGLPVQGRRPLVVPQSHRRGCAPRRAPLGSSRPAAALDAGGGVEVPALGGGLAEVHAMEVQRVLRRARVLLDHLAHEVQARHDRPRNADHTHEPVPHDGVVLDEHLRVGLAPDALDSRPPRPDEQAGHLARQAEPEDVLPRLLAQHSLLLSNGFAPLALPELHKPGQDLVQGSQDARIAIRIHAQHPEARGWKEVALVAEDQLGAGLGLDRVLHHAP
mmetsp:Transcript_5053/g.14914  ORF Transcript_5053/g.14914 Transcript_5053/m.14914 type:complete len:346 (-) Transcript_5053:210-1247(-)